MNPTFRKARLHLRKDKALAPVIERVGKCTLTPQPEEPFVMLVRCVVGQQISTKAARSIYSKLMATVKVLNPTRLAKTPDADLRAVGISGPKQRALRSIVAHVQADRKFLKTLPTLPDDEFRDSVTQIKGIGPWSADMMLMFGYGRLDVMPVGDYGVKVAVKNLYGFKELPSATEMLEIAEPWRPYRSIGAWYLWRSLENE